MNNRILRQTWPVVVLAIAGTVGAVESPQQESFANLHVEIDEDRLTVIARGVSLEKLLAEIAHRSGRRITLDGSPVPPAAGQPPGNDLESDLERLSRALADPDPTVRLTAVSELTGIPDDRAAAALAASALFDEEVAVRQEAIHGLSEIGGRTGVQVLQHVLLDPDPRVREAAVEAVTEIGGEASARALAFALNDEDASLREEAVYALGEIGGDTAILVLQQALVDEQESVREAAADILAELARDPP